MAKIWKKTRNRIIDRERKLDIPYDHYVYAEPSFFVKYGSSFSKQHDNPPKGARNVITINWEPKVAPAAPVLPEPASTDPVPPPPASEAPVEESPADPSQPDVEAASAPAEAEEPKAAPEKKTTKGKGKK